MQVLATRRTCVAQRGVKRTLTTKAMLVRPYTVRKGDTVFKISEKRGIKVEEIISLNHGLIKDKIDEGQTILLPANKLSTRDKEILDGVKVKGYRAYPVRKGEIIDDILSKRKIKREDADALNEGVDLDKLKEYQVIKLPANKFTEREREMLTGVAHVPSEFFSAVKGFPFGKVFLLLLVAGVAGAAAWKSRED